MRDSDGRMNRAALERLIGSLMLLSFGCLMLAYLIAIDRTEWFSLRPASGTAAAMSNAAHAETLPQRNDAERVTERPAAQ